MTELTRCRILVVEDEYMIAFDLQGELQKRGAIVLGPEASIEAAALPRKSRSTPPLDVNLGAECAFAVADALHTRHVPFIFSSGYDDVVTRGRYPDIAICAKPTTMSRLLQTLHHLLSVLPS